MTDCTCIMLGLPCGCARRGPGGYGYRPHGTSAAYRRHLRHGEHPCESCRQAESRRYQDYRPLRPSRARHARGAA